MITELIPTNNRKSFYGKAKVINNDDTIELLSYNTIVAIYNKNNKELTINGEYSNTTTTHIKSFKNYLNL